MDPSSGHMWENPPSGEIKSWSSAKSFCQSLNLGGYTDWELPTISELRSLIRGCPGTVTVGACDVTDSCLLSSSCWDEENCWSCSAGAGPAEGCYWPDEMQGECSWYWSSSPVEDVDDDAWLVNFDNGYVSNPSVDNAKHVRCVR